MKCDIPQLKSKDDLKEDIEFPVVKGVAIAIVRERVLEEFYDWYVFLINENDFEINNIFVTSKGYGETQKTSTLRRFVEKLGPNQAIKLEIIDPDGFHLTHEFWVSYYMKDSPTILDKKFIFLPETIIEKNIRMLPTLQMEGIIHH